MRGPILGLSLLALLPVPVEAHFLMLIPSTDTVDEASGNTVRLELTFTHPMARGPAMPLDRPVRVGAATEAGVIDLAGSLQPRLVDGQPAWTAELSIDGPGEFIVFAEPVPYWEPAEGKMIVHYPKVVVDAYGWGQGWDRLVGLPVEIEPLVRPYGLWAGNVFSGIVRHNGEPVPFAEVEVEWVNDGTVAPPSDAFVTQVVKAGPDGVFSYAMPRAGWWGFAALVEGEQPMKSPDGNEVPVELGALMWVRAETMGAP